MSWLSSAINKVICSPKKAVGGGSYFGNLSRRHLLQSVSILFKSVLSVDGVKFLDRDSFCHHFYTFYILQNKALKYDNISPGKLLAPMQLQL